ncbi:MAG: pyridoxal phosphate-dependent aminotransferase, partial [Thermoplasmatota archaeon]
MGQLAMLLRAKYLVDVHSFTQVRGLPFTTVELADAIVALASLRAGDRTVVERPAYFAILAPARALGAKVTRVAWTMGKDGPELSSAKMMRALVPGTKLLALARPNNPMGARVPDEDLKMLAERCEALGARVLVDEVFAEATTLGDRPAARLHPAILSANSLTKCFGFGPLQAGWLHGDAEAIEEARLAKWHLRPLAPTIDMVAAAAVLERRDSILSATRRRREANVRTVAAFVADHGLAWTGPGAGTTCLLRTPKADDVAFARRLLAREGVLVAPGTYAEMPGWFRLGFLCDPAILAAGLEGLGRALG